MTPPAPLAAAAPVADFEVDPAGEAASLPHLSVVRDSALTPGQREAVAALYLQCFMPEARPCESRIEALRNFLSGQRLFEWYLVTAEKRLIGMAAVVYDYERAFLTDLNQNMGENFVNVAVHPAYRRQGVARWLIREVMHHQRNARDPLVLGVRREDALFNGLCRLYEECGFVLHDDTHPRMRYYIYNSNLRNHS